MTKYAIIIEKGESNYSAYAPDLPGVVAAAETEEETIDLMREAIEFHIQGLKEDKLPIPEPTTTALKLLYERRFCRFAGIL
jgi:predicted RNase H-like HicB family nuclease